MLKRFACFALIVMFLSGCDDGLRVTQPDGRVKVYEPYGLANPELKSNKVCYKIEFLTVLVAILLIETVFVTLYIVGWALYTPVRAKRDEHDSCDVDSDSVSVYRCIGDDSVSVYKCIGFGYYDRTLNKRGIYES